MNLYVIDAGNFKLDGGAMFGVVPKQLWSKKIPADDINLCNWKMRCLLIEHGNQLILVDTGMGDKQPEKWQGHYHRNGEGDLIKSIREKGFHEDQITDVIFSHLHFDHCGGGVKWNKDKTGYELSFKNAKYWTHSEHWAWAMEPNAREKATFLSENLMPIKEAGALNFIDKNEQVFGENFKFFFDDGHTEKMIIPEIKINNTKVIFIADTLPSHAHIPVAWCMAYDVRPLISMQEKVRHLDRICAENTVILYDHDPIMEASTIKKTERGFDIDQFGDLNYLI